LQTDYSSACTIVNHGELWTSSLYESVRLMVAKLRTSRETSVSFICVLRDRIPCGLVNMWYTNGVSQECSY